jgi:hypothetical protein
MRLPLPALFSLSLALAPAGCKEGQEAGHSEIVVLDDASDEVVLTLQERVDRGEVTTDETAARLTSPADGAELSAAPTLTWALRQSTARHGRQTGEFVWLHISGPGVDEPIDIAAIETTSWAMDEEHWDLLRASTGPCEVRVVSAYVDRGIVTEGPFQPSSNPSFSVTGE